MQKKKKTFWIPKDKNGFIDHRVVFQIIYCELKQPYGTLEELSVQEVSWLVEGLENSNKDFYEMVSYSVKNAMVSVNKGKDMKMFDTKNVDEEKKITPESRREDLEFFNKTFK